MSGWRACKACSRSPSWPTTPSAWAMRSSGLSFVCSQPGDICWSGPRPRNPAAARGSTCPGSTDGWRAARLWASSPRPGRLGSPSLLPVTLPFALLWLAAPAVALWASQPPRPRRASALSDAEATELRLIARRTWRFFETFVTPLDNMLPPDNFQEDPAPVIAHRTSPTNIGLYLLSTIAARDLGWTGTVAAVERLEAAFASMQQDGPVQGPLLQLVRHDRPPRARPAYVSSVDSGNLAGHLIATANACEEWIASPPRADGQARPDRYAPPRPRGGGRAGRESADVATLDEIEDALGTSETLEALAPALQLLAARAVDAAREAAGEDDFARTRCSGPRRCSGRQPSTTATDRRSPCASACMRSPRPRARRRGRWISVSCSSPSASCCRSATCPRQRAGPELLRPARVGSPPRQPVRDRQGRRPDPALVPARPARDASRPRLGADLLVGIDVRVSDAVAGHARTPGSQLEQTNRLIVERQQAYGRSLGIPGAFRSPPTTPATWRSPTSTPISACPDSA